MLDVDKSGKPTTLLRLRNYGKSECRFPGGFRTKNFDDSTARKSTNAKSAINQNIASRDDIDVGNLFIAQTHDRTFTVIFGDLLNRKIEIFISRGGHFVFAGFVLGFCRHIQMLVLTSRPTIRQAEKIQNKSKGRELVAR